MTEPTLDEESSWDLIIDCDGGYPDVESLSRLHEKLSREGDARGAELAFAFAQAHRSGHPAAAFYILGGGEPDSDDP